jgi:hypothetical protein
MGAFWSGTDDANENMTQFYGVYGTITTAKPAFLFRYVHGDDKTNINLFELFEEPVVNTVSHVTIGNKTIEIANKEKYEGPWPALEYPSDWMTQHSISYAVSPSYTYGKSAGNHQYGGARQAGATRYMGGGAVDDHYPSDYHWDGHSGYDYSHGDRYNSHLTPIDGQKKTHGSGQSTTRDLIVTTVETETATVDVMTTVALSGFAHGQIQSLINAICKTGYDQFLYEADLRLGTII